MNDRLKVLRKTLEMTQADFAASLDMLQNSYSAIEKGKTRLTDKNITLICLKHGVNETWLRTGIGDMFVDTPAGPVSEDEKKLIDLFRRLVPEMRDIVLKKVREMVKSYEESWVPPKDNEDEKKEKKEA